MNLKEMPDYHLDNQAFLFSVVSPGFEPRQTEPETVVLPLHNETMVYYGAKVAIILIFSIRLGLFFSGSLHFSTFQNQSSVR